jgi:hypothetical protein
VLDWLPGIWRERLIGALIGASIAMAGTALAFCNG